MKIAFLWDGNFPWDIRVEKICRSLAEQGHDVHLLCRNTSFLPQEEIIEGFTVHRLPAFKIPPIVNRLIQFPLFFNPIWYQHIRKILISLKFDIVIVRDITLSLTVIRVAKPLNIPVVLDMAEPYPEMIRAQHYYENLSLLRSLVRNAKLAEWVEKKTLENVSCTFAMVEESQNRLLSLGVPKERIAIVSNTPDIQRFQKGSSTFPGIMSQLKEKIIFLYVGFTDLYRGVQIAIQGFTKILKHTDQAVLVVVGSGGGTKKLKTMRQNLGIEQYVFFEGYQHHTLIPDYIASCDIGLIPHFSCGLWNNTIPNKLFDYMAMGKPVLSSNTKPIHRILLNEKCGITYQDTSPNDFAKQAVRFLDPDLRKEMGHLGQLAVERKYNWDIDSAKMIEHIHSIVASNSHR